MNRAEYVTRIDKLLTRYEKAVQIAWLDSLKNIKSILTLERITNLIEQGAISEAILLVNDTVVRQGMQPMLRETQAAYISGGVLASDTVPQIMYEFSIGGGYTQQFMANYQATLIREITTEMRQAVSESLVDSVSRGISPIESAREYRKALDLTVSQNRAVRSFRDQLESLNPESLHRALRDRRFDSTVSQAIKQKRPLTKEQIDRMVERYRERYILRRSETIARTESTAMLNAGQDAYWKQAVADGQIDAQRLTRIWINTKDGKTRDAHRTIPTLNKDGVGLLEPFRSTLGPIMYPGDPAAVPANRINCRCTVFTRLERDGNE